MGSATQARDIEIEKVIRLDRARGEALGSAAHALNFNTIDLRDQMNMAHALVKAIVYLGDCIRDSDATAGELREAVARAESAAG